MKLMSRYFKLIILCAFAMSTHFSSAQRITSFSQEQEAFLSELAGFMNDSRKKEGRDFIEKDLFNAFQSERIPIQIKIRVNKMCNLLLKHKKKAYPEFHNYLQTVIAYVDSKQQQDDFESWDDVCSEIISNKKLKKHHNPFLENSIGLFKNNTFFANRSVSWRSSSALWELDYNEGKPVIKFPQADLICHSKGDSSVINNTTGAYDIAAGKWNGEGGKILWIRADFDPKTTYAEIPAYEIRIKGSTYSIENVLFYNEFFDEPLSGKLNEKILADRQGDNASYPRFESYDLRLKITDIFKNIDYVGGFTMKGNKLIGTGSNEKPAQIIIHREGEEFLISQSLEFAIRTNKISSQKASLLLKLDEDSISHPSLIFKYDEGNRQLSLIGGEDGQSRSPYYDSYHNIDVFAEAVYWKIDDPLIELSSIKGSTQHYAAFESVDYYNDLRYDAMLGRSTSHPLVEIYDYHRMTGLEEFYDKELASFLRSSVGQLSKQLIDLSNKGFVYYDIETGYITMRPKLYNTLMRNAGKLDYDVLLLNSNVKRGNNGQINLLNNNLLLKGIRQIHVSDSQDVTIYPSNGEVIMKKNREFKFGGRVWAGNFEFIGKDYLFNYEEFKIDLNQVDSCRIYVEDMEASADQFGDRPKLMIKNVLEDITGTLKIDAPTNKSGVHSEDYPGFPIFESTKNTYVYYDDKGIHDGIYNRDKFYYQIEPFVIDSLDNFDRNDLEFNGTLVSSGIFPDIEEPLKLMDDLSLGFNKTTSGGGLPLYGGKGKFTTDITLNYDGLQGAGELDYLTTSAKSDQFYFFPESTKGTTNEYKNQASGNPDVPSVKADIAELEFFPEKDLLSVSSVDSALAFFGNEATLTGTNYLTPGGMTGKGKMDFDDAELSSSKFDYTQRKILADTADFNLSQEGLETLAFKTNNVNAEIDFDERMGLFKSNSGETTVEFPANMYICYMDEFKWFMDKDEMELSSNRKANSDLVIDTRGEKEASNFFSINEFQDSLNFLAPKAKYDIKNSILRCNDIKFITVADSKITPDSGSVVIRKRAKMETLKEATVLSNYITKFHNIFNATIDINGRLDYEGEGDITYLDENKREQIIHLNKLYVDSTTNTRGEGMITESDEFSLSPYFEFQGKFSLLANVPNLTFDGGTRILHTCEELERSWFRFNSEIDPIDIYIPVDTNLRDIAMTKLGVGVIISEDSPIELYSTFLSAKNERKDQELIQATGFLHYDKKGKKYQIGSKEKIQQANFPGNLVELNTESCEILGDGNIDMQVDYGLLTIKNIGNIRNNTNTSETNINGVTLLDFFFDDASMKHITEQIQIWPDLNPINISKTSYEKSIRELTEKKIADKLISDLNLTGEFKKVPEELQNTFYFGDVKYQWDPLNDSYVSMGNLGIATMGKKQVFKYVKGKIEIEKGRSGDVIRLYIELDAANWYYFEYKSSTKIMHVNTTDKVLTELIQKVKEDDRKIKENKMNFSYQLLASKKKRNDFVDRFPEFD